MATLANAAAAASNKPAVLEIYGPGEEGWLTPDQIAALTPESVRQSIVDLQPLIASQAGETERLRRPAPKAWEAIRRTGVFYHLMPKRYGGCEFSFQDFIETMLPIGEVCASTCWATAFTVEHNWLVSHFREEAQEEFFAGGRYIAAPAATNPPGKAVRVPGGFRLTGQWKWGSATMNANWMIGSAMIENEPSPKPFWFAFPADQGEVLDTWYVDGLAGTGSHDIAARGLFVPEHMAVAQADMDCGKSPGAALHANPLYSMSAVSFLAMTTTPAVLGTARGAVKIFRERLNARKIVGSQTVLAENANAQAMLGRAEVMVTTAETLLRKTANDLHELAVRGDSGNPAARKAIVAQNAYVGTLSRDAVRLVTDNSGATAHYLSDPLQRMHRDVTVATSHIIHDFETLSEQLGRSILEQPETTRFY